MPPCCGRRPARWRGVTRNNNGPVIAGRPLGTEPVPPAVVPLVDGTTYEAVWRNERACRGTTGRAGKLTCSRATGLNATRSARRRTGCCGISDPDRHNPPSLFVMCLADLLAAANRFQRVRNLVAAAYERLAAQRCCRELHVRFDIDADDSSTRHSFVGARAASMVAVSVIRSQKCGGSVSRSVTIRSRRAAAR